MKKKVFFGSVFLLLVVANTVALAAESTYQIGPGDVLEISVWKDESLTRQLVVPPDGIMSFPLIGDLDVKYMTVTDVRKAITKKLSEYVPDATVSVILLNLNSLQAYVIGKVHKPGQYAITMETSVMQVLSMAGGINPFADGNKILILRQINNKTVKIPFNHDQVMKGENLQQNIIIQRGDVVVVP
ncbi:MAG: polysaccharide biosynthesis/export family protein [Desulfobacterales bacterium]|nr:polysaccharide biosynthesis/export family protein [Desulfobacterales bacterium]